MRTVTTRPSRLLARLVRILALLCVTLAAPCLAVPTREESERRQRALEQLQTDLEQLNSPADKLKRLASASKPDQPLYVRQKALELAQLIDDPAREGLLAGVLRSDPDALERCAAARALGRLGSEASIPALVEAARNDPTTEGWVGDVVVRINARRESSLALGALGRRTSSAERVAKELRALPEDASVGEARTQALYQVTRDPALLKTFLERLRSPDAKTRREGVVALRFLALTDAPPELTPLLRDPDAGVRSWVALVLGEIGDPDSVGPLMEVAADETLDSGTRCNAVGSLGRMRAARATDLLRRLLDDPEPAIPANAAIAIYRITGEKGPRFPEGFNAD